MIPAGGRLAAAAAEVVARLEWAGAILLRMGTDRSPRLGHRLMGWPWAIPTLDGYRANGARLRFPVPSAAEISEMDRTFCLLQLIPQERHVLRRIAALRSLVGPLTGDHIVSWNEVALEVGASTRAVRAWHRDAIEQIVRRQDSAPESRSSSHGRAL